MNIIQSNRKFSEFWIRLARKNTTNAIKHGISENITELVPSITIKSRSLDFYAEYTKMAANGL